MTGNRRCIGLGVHREFATGRPMAIPGDRRSASAAAQPAEQLRRAHRQAPCPHIPLATEIAAAAGVTYSIIGRAMTC